MSKIWASTNYENKLRASGKLIIAGADEVGRGALAGPIVTCVAALADSFNLAVCDSKKMSRVAREIIYPDLQKEVLAYGIGLVEAAEIDALGLTEALKKAYLRALEAIPISISHLILDGKFNLLVEYGLVETIVAADSKHSSVATASILAKVYRDNLMRELAKKYQDYGFETNVGYGTSRHLAAIKKFGLSDIHRKSFKIA